MANSVIPFTHAIEITTDTTLSAVVGKIYRVVNKAATSKIVTYGSSTLTSPSGVYSDFWYDGSTWYSGSSDFAKTLAPSIVLTVPISGSSVTCPDSNYYTFRLTGTLSEACNFILPNDVKSYKIINDCTGAYNITAKTSAGTGVDLISGQALDVYCDGTNIKTASVNLSSTVLTVPISGSSVTCPDSNYYNIRFTGTLSAVCNFILPNDIKSYKIINDCTGAYSVTAKTSAGTGVALTSGETLEVYCDGTNIKTTGVNLSTTETITNEYFLGYPVYAKVVNFGTLPNTTTKNVAHGISGSFSLFSLNAVAWNAGGTRLILPYVYPDFITNAISMTMDSTNVIVRSATDLTSYTKCYVTLKYIKVAL